MANEVTEEDREALKIAYISLAASGRKSDSFDMDLTVEALRVKKCLNDDSLQLRTLTATKIPAVVLDKTFEESSKRYKITFLANGADKPETVRSERTDGRYSKTVHTLWDRDLVNHRVTIFKNNEDSADPRRSASGFRVAPWVVDFGPVSDNR